MQPKQNQITKFLLIPAVFLLLLTNLSMFASDSSETATHKLFKMSLEELMKVEVISAARVPEKIAEIPASVVLITREDIETYGYTTLTEILENIPGLYAIEDYGEFGASFGVRGFWSGLNNDNIIILVNGVSQVNDFFSNYPLSGILVPVEAMERIEVIRGPMSVVYGSGAFYGVINIITNSAFNREPGEEDDFPGNIVSVTSGSEKTKKVFARFSGQKDNFKYALDASLYDTYGPDHPLAEMMADPSELLLYGLPEDFRTGGNLGSTEKYLNFSGDFAGLLVNLTHSEHRKKFHYLMPAHLDGSEVLNTVTRLSVGCRRKLSKVLTIEGKLTYTSDRTDEQYTYLFDNFYGIQQLKANAWEAEINAFIHPLPNLDITAGLYNRTVFQAENEYDLPSFGTPSLENTQIFLADGNSIVTRALFAQVTYKPFPKLKLVGGLRLEQMPGYSLGARVASGTEYFLELEGTYSREQVDFIPRLAVIYTLNDKNIFKFLYGKAINRPSFFHNTMNHLMEPGEGPLEPETIQTLELNYIAAFSADFILEANVFQNTLEKLITRFSEFKENGDYRTWSENAGKMVTNGIGITINAEPFRDFRMELSGTFQKTKDKRPGHENITVAYSPKTLGYLKASYRTGRFSAAVTGHYAAAMETYWDDSIINPDGSEGNRIADKVKGYFLLDANLRIKKLFGTGLYLNIRCTNLLDKEVRYPTYTNNAWAVRGTLGPGRRFLLSLGYKF
ncbi:MAG: TonB-dependent receptor [bacterium]|nr:TonB-dependent receptor [bacterium]